MCLYPLLRVNGYIFFVSSSLAVPMPSMICRVLLLIIAIQPGIGLAQDAARTRIDLEIALDRGAGPTAARDWYALFTDLGVEQLRIRAPVAGDRPEVTTVGSRDSVGYKVLATVSSRGEFMVPGHRFTARQREEISAWLDDLRARGPQGASGELDQLPFALPVAELAAARKDLSRRVSVSTKDRPPVDILNELADELDHPLVVTKALARAIRESEPASEELRGLAMGTALAYLVRPAGLSIVPRLGRKGQLEYAVIEPAEGTEVWPVGWPPEKPRNEFLPDLFASSSISIDDYPLSKMLDVVSENLKAPILYDHYALAREGVDLDAIRISLPRKQTTYGLALKRALAKAALVYEMRVDEAEKPFLWVTTVKAMR